MRSSIVIALIAAACAVTAPAALADATNSSNWAGYAVHKPGVLFHTVSGTWRQPDAKCTPGAQSYSAFWVGLGGFSLNAPALEQTGTEVDNKVYQLLDKNYGPFGDRRQRQVFTTTITLRNYAR